MLVYIYARKSPDRETEASIADQLRVCREYAQRQGWEISREFVDEGISGFAVGNRPAVLDILATLGAGDVMLIIDTTRLARSQDLAPMITRIRYRGVRVIGVLDGFDSSSTHADMQAGLSGLMSSELLKNIARRTHSGLQMRAKMGRPTGGKAYGYTKANTVEPAEALVLVEIFRRAAEGESLREIACDLNARGVPAPGAGWKRESRRQDGRWLVSALHAILTNERYIGRLVWNRSVWVKDPDSGVRQRRERPQAEWVIGTGPALVDEPTWSRIRARMSERARVYGTARGARPRYILSGLLYCAACSAKMVVTGVGGSHYYCGTHHHGGAAACSMRIGVRRELVEDLVLRPIESELLSPEAVGKALEFITGWAREQRVAGAHPDLAALDREIEALDQLVTERPELATTLRDAADNLRQRRQKLQALAWRKASGSVAPAAEAAGAAYRLAVETMRDKLRGTDKWAAREALQTVVGPIGLRPAAEGRHLVASVGLDARSLLLAAGISRIGSGGLLCIHEIELVRTAA